MSSLCDVRWKYVETRVYLILSVFKMRSFGVGAEAWHRNKDRIVKLLRSEALRDKESKIRRNKRVLRYAQTCGKNTTQNGKTQCVDQNYVVKRVKVKYGKEVFERNRERASNASRQISFVSVRRFSSQMDEKQLGMNENNQDEDVNPSVSRSPRDCKKLLEKVCCPNESTTRCGL